MRTVGKLACALALVAACSSSDEDPPAQCAAATWRPAITTLDRSVLCAWGTGAHDVYMVGGDLGVGGAGALLLHWDGSRFTEMPAESDRTLWWIWGTPDAGTMWLVGESGTVLRRTGGRMEPMVSGTDATLFGVWGAAADAVWIVGGMPGPESNDKDLILRWDGKELRREQLSPPRNTALLKIWGSAADDVWVVGEGGTLWHRGPSGWTDRSAELATAYTVNSVHGCGRDDVYAVGGKTIFHYDGNSWSHVAEAEELISGSVVGVSCGARAVAVVGAGGLKLRLDRATARWHDETIAEPWNTDFHGAWIAPEGDIWAVGGNYGTPAASTNARIGVVGYRGCDQPSWENP